MDLEAEEDEEDPYFAKLRAMEGDAYDEEGNEVDEVSRKGAMRECVLVLRYHPEQSVMCQ